MFSIMLDDVSFIFLDDLISSRCLSTCWLTNDRLSSLDAARSYNSFVAVLNTLLFLSVLFAELSDVRGLCLGTSLMESLLLDLCSLVLMSSSIRSWKLRLIGLA